jgi:hypothetical protein
MKLRGVLAAIAVVATGVAALAAVTEGFRVVTSEGAWRLAVAERPRPLPDAALTDQAGRTFRLSGLHGRPVLVEFLYMNCMNCPAICGLLASQFQAGLETLLARPQTREVLLLSIALIRRAIPSRSLPITPAVSAPTGGSGASPASAIRPNCQACSMPSASSCCRMAPAASCTTPRYI